MDGGHDVLLITSDAELREAVRRCCPPGLRLRTAQTCGDAEDANSANSELWIDLDSCHPPLPTTASRRVLFHSSAERPSGELPRGLFIRKPCAENVLRVLWSGVRPRGPKSHTEALPQPGALPGWIAEFHQLGLRELCRACVRRLPQALGYADVSLYLHDPDRRVLTLAETTLERPIDFVIPVSEDKRHLMVAVARGGRLLETTRAPQERRQRGLPPADSPCYTDDTCLVAPLTSGGRIWGVLNLSRRVADSPPRDFSPEAVFQFIGRSLRFARAYDRARTEARVDALTGLYNQRWLRETLTKEIRRSQRYGTPLSLVVIDLDGLKAVNDSAGHPAGDCLIRHVAGRINSVLRQLDSAARVGGDEFVVLLPATDLEGAHQVAQRVLTAIRGEAAIYADIEMPIRASLGVAQWEQGWEATQLIAAADEAMYEAKRCGRNQLVCRARNPLRSICIACANDTNAATRQSSAGIADNANERQAVSPCTGSASEQSVS